MEKENNLDFLKKEYEKIQKKHHLPSFNEINEDFSIEKIDSEEIELLIREVRKFIGDKLSGYMRLTEAILNPMNVQMFVYSLIKSLSPSDKDKLKEIYKELSKLELRFIELDIQYSEEKEATFIKDAFSNWQKMKKDLLEILENANKNWNTKIKPNSKDYFG